jgi:A/G-specific adenine glycosylase
LPGAGWSTDFEFENAARLAPFAADWRRIPGFVEQVFTHFTLRLAVYAGAVAHEEAAADCYWIEEGELASAALSSVMVKAIAHARRHEAGRSSLVEREETLRPLNTRRRGSSAKKRSRVRS